MALQLFDNSSLSYLSPSSSGSFESISFALKPGSGFTSGGVILTASGPSQDQFSIAQAENGTLQFQCNEKTATVINEVLERDEWYQLYATRYTVF